MNKEEVITLASLLTTLKEYSKKMEEALKNKDSDKLENIKKEIILIIESIDKML
ncbi:MAG: hypothetical protein AABX66_04070 [Nanoarchaeota archaeon]